MSGVSISGHSRADFQSGAVADESGAAVVVRGCNVELTLSWGSGHVGCLREHGDSMSPEHAVKGHRAGSVLV